MKILWVVITIFLFQSTGFGFLKRKYNYQKNTHSIRCQKMQDHIYKRETFLQKHFRKKKIGLNKKYEKRLLRIEKRKNHLPPKKYHDIKNNVQKWYVRETKQLEYQEKISQKKISNRKNQLESLIYLVSVQ